MSHATPAGDGAARGERVSRAAECGATQGDGAEREERYAAPWDASEVESKLKKYRLIEKIYLISFPVFYVLIMYDCRLKESFCEKNDAESMLFNVVYYGIAGYSVLKFGLIGILPDLIKNNGWINYEKYQLQKPRMLAILFLLFIIQLPIVEIIMQLTIDDILFFTISIVLIFIWLFLEILTSIRVTYVRRFPISEERIISLTQPAINKLIPNDTIEMDLNKWHLIDRNLKIKIESAGNRCEAFVYIRTPRNQPERNRELREAVSAILEGRPWPPEPSDGDAPDSGRPEEGA